MHKSIVRKSPSRKLRVSKITNARDAIKEFDKGLELFCFTFGQFSLFEAVEAVLEKTGPADVAISTWTAASADLKKAEQFLRDSRIKRLRFIVDCSFINRQPGYTKVLCDLFGDDAIRTTRTHAKFVTIKNEDWNVVIRTSMNLNENPRLENIEITDDMEFCAFFNQVVDEIFIEEAPKDWSTKKHPQLPGMEGIEPVQLIAMNRVQLKIGGAKIG